MQRPAHSPRLRRQSPWRALWRTWNKPRWWWWRLSSSSPALRLPSLPSCRPPQRWCQPAGSGRSRHEDLHQPDFARTCRSRRTFSRPSAVSVSFQLFMYSPGNLSLLNTPTVLPSLLPLMASIILSKLPLLLSFCKRDKVKETGCKNLGWVQSLQRGAGSHNVEFNSVVTL